MRSMLPAFLWLCFALGACAAEKATGRSSRLKPKVAPSGQGTHVVQPGETLWRITRLYQTTVDALMKDNGIGDVTRVRTGTALRVPLPDGSKASAQAGE